jgi:hypothetical protein
MDNALNQMCYFNNADDSISKKLIGGLYTDQQKQNPNYKYLGNLYKRNALCAVGENSKKNCPILVKTLENKTYKKTTTFPLNFSVPPPPPPPSRGDSLLRNSVEDNQRGPLYQNISILSIELYKIFHKYTVYVCGGAPSVPTVFPASTVT